ncbi:MAG: Dabb family protein [Opitutaceae bacterium]|nr:Dabb family protein [Opitutaceae bacterium]
MKKLVSLLLAAAVLATAGFAADGDKAAKKTKGAANTAPKTVIHVVTVKWKAGTTEAQIKAALDGAQALPKSYPGITRVWTKTFKAQGDKTHAIVMEFASEKALADYSGSDAQKKWYEAYIPIRDASTTFDITN